MSLNGWDGKERKRGHLYRGKNCVSLLTYTGFLTFASVFHLHPNLTRQKKKKKKRKKERKYVIKDPKLV